MPISRNDWFPTPIWHFTVDNHQQLNSILLPEIEAEQQRDRVGEKWSNILGWHSQNNLHERDRFSKFTQIIDRNVLEIELDERETTIVILFDFLRKMILMNLGKIKFRAVIKQLK